MLQQNFLSLLSNYTPNVHLMNELWTAIETPYTDKKRYYHSLQHLESLFVELIAIQNRIEQWEVVLFSLYYHDVVYEPLRSDNEEKSAIFSEQHLQQLHVPTLQIERIKQQIIATKSHAANADMDTNYFTDADLSILGQNWATYSIYLQHIRKEYAILPDFIYNRGRKKVLEHFLAMPRIYKTDYFFRRLEQQARHNLQQEVMLLNKWDGTWT